MKYTGHSYFCRAELNCSRFGCSTTEARVWFRLRVGLGWRDSACRVTQFWRDVGFKRRATFVLNVEIYLFIESIRRAKGLEMGLISIDMSTLSFWGKKKFTIKWVLNRNVIINKCPLPFFVFCFCKGRIKRIGKERN